MGCDFEIQIEVLYGSVWVPIVLFETKTRCGGHPLCTAVYKLKESRGVTGNYGREQETCPSDGSRIDAIRFYKSSALKSNRKVKSATEEAPVAPVAVAKRKRAEEPTDEDSESEWDNRKFVYYSMEELPLYISEVRKIESNTVEEFECNRLMYTKLLEPVLKIWCTMALTAVPVRSDKGYFWMDHGQVYVDNVTKKFRSAQVALAAAHTRFMSQFKAKFPLPGE